MSTAEVAELRAGVESFPESRVPRWALVRRIALAAYVVGLVVFTVTVGVPLQRELVLGWVCGGLATASIGRSWREILQLLRDWLPLAAVLLAYDFTRGAADSFGISPHFMTMIDFDKFLFFGETPTAWLQDHIYDPNAIHWWDVCFTFVYTSHFIVPFAVAGVLWARSRDAFVKFSRRFVTLSVVGLATYIVFPAAPPWMASQQGLLPPIARSTARGWEVVNLHAAESFSKGQGIVNLVAAVPSLHAAFAMLVCLFLWPRVGWYWRPLLACYPLAMGLALIATGEHYAFDVLLGWLSAALVMAGWGYWERRREAAALGGSRTRPAAAVP